MNKYKTLEDIFNDPDFNKLTTPTIKIECTPEFTDPREELSEEKTGADHSEWLDWIDDQLIDHCNMWAWCTVKVTATLCGVEGVNYLGDCSYKDEEDFKKNSGYFEHMIHEAKADLDLNIERLLMKGGK
jgi:hypothetical protein